MVKPLKLSIKPKQTKQGGPLILQDAKGQPFILQDANSRISENDKVHIQINNSLNSDSKEKLETMEFNYENKRIKYKLSKLIPKTSILKVKDKKKKILFMDKLTGKNLRTYNRIMGGAKSLQYRHAKTLWEHFSPYGAMIDKKKGGGSHRWLMFRGKKIQQIFKPHKKKEKKLGKRQIKSFANALDVLKDLFNVLGSIKKATS